MKFVALSLLSLLAMTLHGMAREPVAPQKSQMFAKLQLKLPQDHLKQATLDEAVDLLRFHALMLDPESEGLNLLILQTNKDDDLKDRVIDEVHTKDLSLLQALSLICRKTKTQYRIDDHAVVIIPLADEADEPDRAPKAMIQRSWGPLPGFLDYISPPAAELGHVEVSTLLKSLGVPFPPGSSLSFLAGRQTLIVRNTPASLELIDAVVQASKNPEATLKERETLDKTIIPSTKLVNCTLSEACEYLRIRATELDPDQKGIDLSLLGGKKVGSRVIKSLNLRFVPLSDTLQYICEATNTRPHLWGRTIIILPKD